MRPTEKQIQRKLKVSIPLWDYLLITFSWYGTHTHTHTHPFNGRLSGTTKVSQYQKGKNQSGFYWSKRQWVAVASPGPYASLHLAPDRTMPAPPPLTFLQAAQPTASKHWRLYLSVLYFFGYQFITSKMKQMLYTNFWHVLIKFKAAINLLQSNKTAQLLNHIRFLTMH